MLQLDGLHPCNEGSDLFEFTYAKNSFGVPRDSTVYRSRLLILHDFF